MIVKAKRSELLLLRYNSESVRVEMKVYEIHGGLLNQTFYLLQRESPSGKIEGKLCVEGSQFTDTFVKEILVDYPLLPYWVAVYTVIGFELKRPPVNDLFLSCLLNVVRHEFF